MIGAIIKQHRLNRNYSQTTLSEGICAVSYLSKIETGQVTPNQEIIDLLLERLGISLSNTSSNLEDLKKMIKGYFHESYYGRAEEANDLYQTLLGFEDYLLNSNLAIDWHLIKAKELYTNRLNQEAHKELTTLKAYQAYFSEDQSANYFATMGMVHSTSKTMLEALSYFKKSHSFKRNGMILFLLEKTEFLRGNYIQAINYGNEAYNLLMKEGNLHYSIESTQLLAAAYSNMNQVETSLALYQRLLEIGKYLKLDHIMFSAYYNIGATYLTAKRYQEAKKYFDQLDAYMDTINLWNWLLAYQKFILCDIGLGLFEEAREKLKEVQEALDNKPLTTDETLVSSFDWLAFFNDSSEPYHDPAYLSAIRKTYNLSVEHSHHGYKLFYSSYLIQALMAQRKYKEAMEVQQNNQT